MHECAIRASGTSQAAITALTRRNDPRSGGGRELMGGTGGCSGVGGSWPGGAGGWPESVGSCQIQSIDDVSLDRIDFNPVMLLPDQACEGRLSRQQVFGKLTVALSRENAVHGEGSSLLPSSVKSEAGGFKSNPKQVGFAWGMGLKRIEEMRQRQLALPRGIDGYQGLSSSAARVDAGRSKDLGCQDEMLWHGEQLRELVLKRLSKA
jgi:hypothetical protein